MALSSKKREPSRVADGRDPSFRCGIGVILGGGEKAEMERLGDDSMARMKQRILCCGGVVLIFIGLIQLVSAEF
jgi:hypothetical protein